MNKATKIDEDQLEHEVEENVIFSVGIMVTGLEELNRLLEMAGHFQIGEIKYIGHRTPGKLFTEIKTV